jgi:glycosyltransferase involved in cell wall biosynthesis
MTGGPVGIIGGGFAAVDSVEGRLGRPSKLIEKLALSVTRQFDLVVVRGSGAREFLTRKGITDSVAVVTGSINGHRPAPGVERDIHLIYVGRLAPIKQVEQVIAIVAAMRKVRPDIRAIIVGDGPAKADLERYAEQLGVSGSVEFLGKRKDVHSFLARSRVFLLTSKSEGLSIALAESMAAGVVPVVAHVGDLSDLVVDGENGYLIEPDAIEQYAAKARLLLDDDALWRACSSRAVEAARRHCHIDSVSQTWRRHLQATISRASRRRAEEVRQSTL